ncbi:cation-translocating P-type ATPase [Nocardia neocaledoniensis]|uniref:cation-translocating P-type ATPase n=1 Tax=Nocardia neocaledoniensis TaxID=236511 RepID=UPI0024551C33|nr:cation-transporting P-type ATPase [Nocardia neocaledoniensis]
MQTAVDSRGLTDAEAAARHRREGANTLPEPPPPHRIAQFAAQLTHFFAAMLWTAAALALVAGMPALAIAIACVVILNGVFAFVQEFRADRAAQRLRDLLPVKATVRRGGRVVTVDSSELVVGDLLVLEAGDRICADATLLAAHVAVDESMLTGEAESVQRGAGAPVLAGTFVVAGHGEAEVSAIGTATRLASLAAVTAGATRPPSPLTRQLHRVVRLVALIAVLVGASAFGVFAALGQDLSESLLFAIGVTVALVPEGLLPTVTLSLARAGQRMARQNALVRRLEAVETLGATTFICTDKTGTLTRNEMQVVEVWTPRGPVTLDGAGYGPDATLTGAEDAIAAARTAADSAARCSPDAHAQLAQGVWVPIGDPMEVAVHVLAARVGAPVPPAPRQRTPFDTHTRRASVVDAEGEHTTGAPEAVFALCGSGTEEAAAQVTDMTARGLRVLAVARAAAAGTSPRLLGVLGLEDPPRPDVAAAIAACRDAGIQVAMVTGDHPGTAAAIAEQVGLFGPDRVVVSGADLPDDDARLASMLDRGGVVVARVAPEQKLRIAAALQQRGHVVAMTGDGVNDGPALRTADIGIAMGASGTDVAREAADLVLLDDHFGTIVAAIQLGRATFANIRRFLTYHLTDNVAELAPFALWAASGGTIPLGITVLQVLALDIGTDMLPALALGAEPPNPRTMSGPPKVGTLIDRTLLRRVFGVLGPTEAAVGVGTFLTVLLVAGWRFGDEVSAGTLASASGALFVSIVLGQLSNAFACRSETRWVGAVGWRGNPLLLATVAIEISLLVVFLWVPPLPTLLGGAPPSPLGWVLAAGAIPALLAADTAHKVLRHRRQPSSPAVRRPTSLGSGDGDTTKCPPT